jgi:hypothetical protein
MFGLEERGAGRNLREVETVHIVISASFQISHEDVERGYPQDSKRFHLLGHFPNHCLNQFLDQLATMSNRSF